MHLCSAVACTDISLQHFWEKTENIKQYVRQHEWSPHNIESKWFKNKDLFPFQTETVDNCLPFTAGTAKLCISSPPIWRFRRRRQGLVSVSGLGELCWWQAVNTVTKDQYESFTHMKEVRLAQFLCFALYNLLLYFALQRYPLDGSHQ